MLTTGWNRQRVSYQEAVLLNRMLLQIFTWFGKSSLDAISIKLAAIINCSMVSGVVLTKFKTAKRIQIFKLWDKKQISNYRPMSILTYFSKFFNMFKCWSVMSCISARTYYYNGTLVSSVFAKVFPHTGNGCHGDVW